MEMEIWKSNLSVLVNDFQKELTLIKEGKSNNDSKIYELLKLIMIHYFGEERLEKIWDGQCLSLMTPLTVCKIEFNEGFMRVSRKSDNADAEIVLGNQLMNNSAGCFSRDNYFIVSENETAHKDIFGDIVVDYTNKGDKVCYHHDKRIEPETEAQEVSWTVAQLSKIKESDLKQENAFASKLIDHGVSNAVNMGNGLREHFSLSNEEKLYIFDVKTSSLQKENVRHI